MNTKGIVPAVLAALIVSGGCRRAGEPATAESKTRPSILLVTLDTTRADAIGPGAAGVETPSFNALAARGRRIAQAYATRAGDAAVAHVDHDRPLSGRPRRPRERAVLSPARIPCSPSGCRRPGYRTAAFVSSSCWRAASASRADSTSTTTTCRRGASERRRAETTDRALAELQRGSAAPAAVPLGALLRSALPVHAAGAVSQPLRGAAVSRRDRRDGSRSSDACVAAFDAAGDGLRPPSSSSADHGEGLGDHGESQHGNLLYQSTMHVPLVLAGPGVAAGASDTPVSTRRIFHTAARDLGWASATVSANSLRGADGAPEVGARRSDEAVSRLRLAAAGHGRRRAAARRSWPGKLEVYDVARRSRARRRTWRRARTCRRALRSGARRLSGAVARGGARAPQNLDDEARRRLASLGYVSAGAAPVVRKDAPRPADMVALFAMLEKASGLFVHEQYAAGRSRCSRRSWRRIRTTSTRRCGSPRRTRRSATTRRRWRRSSSAAAIAPQLAGRPHLPRAALRARARTGSAPCRCSSGSSPKRRTGCRRSRRWP